MGCPVARLPEGSSLPPLGNVRFPPYALAGSPVGHRGAIPLRLKTNTDMRTCIDTRDLDTRLEELRALRDAVADAQVELAEAKDAAIAGPEDETLATSEKEAQDAFDAACAEFGTDEQNELAELEDLESEVSGWSDGNTLIPEDEFVDYCRELLEDCGDLPKDFPSYVVIDWEATADNIRADYSLVEFQGDNYLYRA